MFYNSGGFTTFPWGLSKINNKRVFAIIREINEALSLTNEPQKLVNAALDALCQTLKVECCWIQTIDEGKDRPLTLAAERGFNAEIRSEMAAMSMKHDFSGKVVGMGEQVIIPDFSNDGVYGLSSFKNAGYRWLAAVPLLTYRVYGILGIASRDRKILQKETADLEMVVASLIASALGKAHLSRGLTPRKAAALLPVQEQRQNVKPEPPSVPELKQDAEPKPPSAPLLTQDKKSDLPSASKPLQETSQELDFILKTLQEITKPRQPSIPELTQNASPEPPADPEFLQDTKPEPLPAPEPPQDELVQTQEKPAPVPPAILEPPPENAPKHTDSAFHSHTRKMRTFRQAHR